jgi:hypothetical protein
MGNSNGSTSVQGLERAVSKVVAALGIDALSSATTDAERKVAAALDCEQERYRLALLDLETEFTLRQQQERQFHLRRMAEIIELGE